MLIIASVIIYRVSINHLKQSALEEVSAELFSESILEADKIRIHFFPFGITIRDITLDTPENFDFRRSEKPGDLITSLSIENIEMKGIRLFSFLFRERLIIKEVNINSPNLEMIAVIPGKERVRELFSNGNSGRHLEITEFNLNDLYLTGLQEFERINKNLFEINDFSLNMKNINLSEGSYPARDLPGNTSFTAGNFTLNLPSEHYSFSADIIRFSGADSTFSIRNSKLRPLLTPQLMSEDLGHETDHFDMVSGPIELLHIKPDKIFHSNQLAADALNIEGMKIYISRDKNFDEKPRTERPLPSVMFYKLPYGISINEIQWKNGFINYREWREGQVTSGDILFDETDITIQDFQNLDNTQNFYISARTKFLGITEMDVNFDISMDDVGTHHISGEIAGFDLTELNTVLEPLAFSRIRSGELESLNFRFTLDDYKSEGKVKVIYDGLEMRMLDEESLEETNRMRVASFFANLVRVRSSNSNDDPKIGEVDHERDKERSIFTYWWKSLQSGIESGINQ